jgi:hypothetical protein
MKRNITEVTMSMPYDYLVVTVQLKSSIFKKFYMCYSYFNVALFSCYFVPWYKTLSVSILLNDSGGFSTMFDE